MSLTRIEDLITEATKMTKQDAIQNIKKHEHGDRYKDKPTYLDEFIEPFYEQNKNRFRHGKKTLGILKGLLQKELKINPDLLRQTTFLNDQQLYKYGKMIWDID